MIENSNYMIILEPHIRQLWDKTLIPPMTYDCSCFYSRQTAANDPFGGVSYLTLLGDEWRCVGDVEES